MRDAKRCVWRNFASICGNSTRRARARLPFLMLFCKIVSMQVMRLKMTATQTWYTAENAQRQQWCVRALEVFSFSWCLAWRRAWYQLIGNMRLLYAKFFIFSLRTWHGKFNTKIYISWCHFWGFEGLHSPHTRQPRRVCSATANKWTKIFDVNLENGNYLLATTHH